MNSDSSSWLRRRRAMLALVMSGAAAIAGCGGGDVGGPKSLPRATAAGSVTFDGKPVPAGVVNFEHEESKWMASCQIADGKYSCVGGEGPLIGKNIITISGRNTEGRLLWGGTWSKKVDVTEAGVTADFEIAKEHVGPAPKENAYSTDPGDQ